MTAAADPTTPISAAEAVTLDGLFRERVARTPEAVAYRDYNQQHANWRDYTWAQIDRQVARWQAALERDGLKAGDRVGVMLRNSTEWVIFDQAAMGLGLVVVPLFTQDRCDNVAYILNDANCKVLLLGTREQWKAFATVRDQLSGLVRLRGPGRAGADLHLGAQILERAVRVEPRFEPARGRLTTVVAAPAAGERKRDEHNWGDPPHPM